MFRRLPARLHQAAYAALLASSVGCGHFRHVDPDACVLRPADTVSAESKSCVYVFLIDPLHPFAPDHLKGKDEFSLKPIRGFLNDLGFIKTYSGHTWHASHFAEKMRTINGCCGSHARLVLIGHDTGATAARGLAERMAAEGIPIELVIAVDPHDDVDVAAAGECVTIRPGDLESHEDGKPVTTHPETLAIIERELSLVAWSVPPRPRPEPKIVQLVEPIPPPRALEAKPADLPPEWQFLRPQPPRPMTRETLPPPVESELLPPPKL